MLKNLLEKAENLKLNTAGKVAIITPGIMLAVTTCAFADGTTGGTASAMGSALAQVQSDALSGLTTVAPYAIAIMGAFLVWRYGIRFFKSLSK